ncbi:uncharacterized protein LOC142239128 [Haematobia irritans]|uniref:uncharacterized protein LOC142239128 n=1 Tax=Haematobia irritans TaxID=7368 RepID=UPI003F4F5874
MSDKNESKSKKYVVNPVAICSPSRDKSVSSDSGKSGNYVVNPLAIYSINSPEKNKSNPEKNEGSSLVASPMGDCEVVNSSKEPRYETNKIIIPTKVKNRSRSDGSSPAIDKNSSSKVAPSFSTKDCSVRGILGVEYVIKILKSPSDNSPRYECGLCELVLDAFAMQCHLEGYNHRLKFCEKHFPTAIRHYRQYIYGLKESESVNVMKRVLAKLAIEIEKYHGRSLPYECFERDFSLNRHQILAKAFSCRHASEQFGPTFTHVVESREIDAFRNDKSETVSLPLPAGEVFDTKCERIVIPTRNREEVRVRNSSSPNRNIYCDRNERLYRNKSRYESERNIEHRNDQRIRNDKTFEKRDEPRSRDNSLRSQQTFTNRNDLLEKSGELSYCNKQASESWREASSYAPSRNQYSTMSSHEKTYEEKVDEFLRETNSNHQRDRFRPIKRHSQQTHSSSSPKRKNTSPKPTDILQIYEDIVNKQVCLLQEKFDGYKRDPESYPSYSEEWIKFWKRRKDELTTAGIDHRNYNYQAEWKLFIKERMDELFNIEIQNIKHKTRELLGFPMPNSEVNTNTDLYNNSSNNGAVPPKIVRKPEEIVSVLRMMTAFEEHLGNVGPKITTLLSKCLQMSKSDADLMPSKILNEQNKALIKIAAENLKALVHEGIIGASKERTIQKIVQEAYDLLAFPTK